MSKRIDLETGQFAQHLCDCGCRGFVNKGRRFVRGHRRSPRRCACGCGKIVRWSWWSKYRTRQFLKNHQMRGVSKTIKPPKGWIPPTGKCECGCGARTSIATATSRRRHQYRGYRLRFIQGHARRTTCPRNTPTGYLHLRVGGKYILQHRLIMSQMLGRPLRQGEEVHHKNGDRRDNRRRNLELWMVSQPPGQRARDLVTWARQLLVRYGHEFPEH